MSVASPLLRFGAAILLTSPTVDARGDTVSSSVPRLRGLNHPFQCPRPRPKGGSSGSQGYILRRAFNQHRNQQVSDLEAFVDLKVAGGDLLEGPGMDMICDMSL